MVLYMLLQAFCAEESFQVLPQQSGVLNRYCSPALRNNEPTGGIRTVLCCDRKHACYARMALTVRKYCAESFVVVHLSMNCVAMPNLSSSAFSSACSLRTPHKAEHNAWNKPVAQSGVRKLLELCDVRPVYQAVACILLSLFGPLLW